MWTLKQQIEATEQARDSNPYSAASVEQYAYFHAYAIACARIGIEEPEEESPLSGEWADAFTDLDVQHAALVQVFGKTWTRSVSREFIDDNPDIGESLVEAWLAGYTRAYTDHTSI